LISCKIHCFPHKNNTVFVSDKMSKVLKRKSDVCLFDEEEAPVPKRQQSAKKHTVLKKEDIVPIRKIAGERHSKNVAAKVKERKSVPRNGLVLGEQGMIGEWLLYKLFNLDTAPLFDTTPRNFQSDTQRDARIHGKRIEVKTTYSHRFGIRVEMREAKNPADFYAFVTAVRKDRDALLQDSEEIDCIFHGFVSAAELLQPKNLVRWSDGRMYYCLPNEQFQENVLGSSAPTPLQSTENASGTDSLDPLASPVCSQ